MAKLGQLIIELAANTARLQSDMGKAVGIVETGARKMGGAFKALGVVGGGGFLASVIGQSVKHAIKLGDELQKASIKSGIGAKAISELAYAAKLADVDLNALSTSIKKMQISLSEAGTGAKGPILALQALGLTVEQLQKRKPDEQFALIGDRISKLADPADRARAAVELFGKAGADLLPLFEQGAAGIAKARAEAEKLGLSFNDDQLKKLSEADDAIKRLNASWEGFGTTLTAKVAGPLANIMDRLAGIDTRSTAQKLSDIEAALVPRRGLIAQERERLEAERDRLRGMEALERARAEQTGTVGGPTGRTASDRGSVIGFAAANAAEKEAEKQGEFVGITADQYQDLYDDIGRMRDDALEEDAQREIERLKFYEDAEKERQQLAEEVAAFNEEQMNKLSAGAQIFKDALMQGWDDWVHSGKIKVDEMIKYILLAFARAGIDSALTNLFSGNGAGGNFWSSLFGGARASGGPVNAGKFYMVGENGPELLAAGASGSIIPNHALGGSMSISLVNHIDARGASVDLVRVLPTILRQSSKETEARIIDRLNRGNYPVLRR